jgi:hypothetical protein
VPGSQTRHHHGSHQGLLQPAVDTVPAGGGVDAIIVPTARRPAYLAEVGHLAEELNCPLVTLHSTKRTTAAEAARRLGRGVDLIAIDVPPEAGRLHLPSWETSRLLAGTVFARRTDVSAKRNLALMLSYMLGWSRVLFLDDDITRLDSGDVRMADRLLDQHSAVGLQSDGYPDHSVACHAYRLAGGSQQAFVGAGALAVELTRSRSFFPDIYNDDWFFLLDGDRYLQSTTVTGHVYQHPYDPFRTPERARGEELGDVLAEGLYWLLDQDRSIMEADEPHWSMFLARRSRFIQDVLEMVEAAGIDPHEKERRIAALRRSLGRLALITPALCERYLRAWAADRRQWQRHVDLLPLCLQRPAALAALSRQGSPRLNWHLSETSGPRATQGGPSPDRQLVRK